jgi:tRNA pseudouridine55 synthase
MNPNSKFDIHISKQSPISDVILVDKPSGWTSHDVVQHFRRKLGIKKIGHTGTLDPLATGLLILLVGSVTKRQQQFQKLDKVYLVEALLGFTSDTYDIEGKVVPANPGGSACRPPGVDVEGVIQTSGVNLSKSQITKALSKFRGPITQKVPPFSAVKVQGKKLYQHARKGTIDKVKIPERKVEIYDIQLVKVQKNRINTTPGVRIPEPPGLNLHSEPPGFEFQSFSPLSSKTVLRLPPSVFQPDNTFVTLQVRCSSGTYIRSLVHDLGQELGCDALVTTLRRIQVGDYHIKDAETISPN